MCCDRAKEVKCLAAFKDWAVSEKSMHFSLRTVKFTDTFSVVLLIFWNCKDNICNHKNSVTKILRRNNFICTDWNTSCVHWAVSMKVGYSWKANSRVWLKTDAFSSDIQPSSFAEKQLCSQVKVQYGVNGPQGNAFQNLPCWVSPTYVWVISDK